MKVDFSDVGARIRTAISKKHITKAELSRMTGISQNAITNYCKDVRLPDTSSIFLIAQALDTSVEWLLSGEDTMGQTTITSPVGMWELQEYQRQAINETLSNLTEEQALLLDNYEKLTPPNKREVRGIIQLKLESQMDDAHTGRSEKGLA